MYKDRFKDAVFQAVFGGEGHFASVCGKVEPDVVTVEPWYP